MLGLGLMEFGVSGFGFGVGVCRLGVTAGRQG